MNIRPSPAGAETDTRPFVLAFAGYVWGKAEAYSSPIPWASFEATVFSELLASERDKLEARCSLLLHVNAQFEGDSGRWVAQRIEALDRLRSIPGVRDVREV
jgi:hypothetical protein